MKEKNKQKIIEFCQSYNCSDVVAKREDELMSIVEYIVDDEKSEVKEGLFDFINKSWGQI